MGKCWPYSACIWCKASPCSCWAWIHIAMVLLWKGADWMRGCGTNAKQRGFNPSWKLGLHVTTDTEKYHFQYWCLLNIGALLCKAMVIASIGLNNSDLNPNKLSNAGFFIQFTMCLRYTLKRDFVLGQLPIKLNGYFSLLTHGLARRWHSVKKYVSLNIWILLNSYSYLHEYCTDFEFLLFLFFFNLGGTSTVLAREGMLPSSLASSSSVYKVVKLQHPIKTSTPRRHLTRLRLWLNLTS